MSAKKEKHFLIIDDEGKVIKEQLDTFHKEKGCVFHLIERFEKNELYKALEEYPEISVILLDLYDSNENPRNTKKPAGLRLIESLWEDLIWNNNYGMKVLVVILTSHPSLTTRYHAAKKHLEKYMDKKELSDTNLLIQIWHRAQDIRNLGLLPSHLREGELIFDPETVEMRAILENVRKVAKFDVPILIRGETGCGKDLLAKAIWEEIKRQSKDVKGIDSFIPYNISQVEPTLLRSELFGYLRNSFTGAAPKGKKGVFQVAHERKATLLLDEIGDAPLDLQVALLRVLENHEIIPVGGAEPGFVDGDGKLIPGKKIENIRLMFATHRPLEELIEEVKFRGDFFHRINVFAIEIKPLRDRPQDIRILSEHFRQKFNEKYKLNLDFPDDENILEILVGYHWPGNVRELEHDLLKSYIVSCENPDGKIRLADDVREKLTGKKQHDLSNVNDIYNLFTQLPLNPESLPSIAKERGEPIAIELGKCLILKIGRWPTAEELENYFKMTPGAFKRWMHERKITLHSLRVKRGRA